MITELIDEIEDLEEFLLDYSEEEIIAYCIEKYSVSEIKEWLFEKENLDLLVKEILINDIWQ